MRWKRPNTEDQKQASTSYDDRAPNSHRRLNIHHMEDELRSTDELFFGRPSAERRNSPIDSQEPYLDGSYSPNHAQKVGPYSSVIVFAFALSGILLIFLLFYFLAKVCSPPIEDDIKDQQNEAGNIGRKTTIRKMAAGVNESPKSVLYPRRIYELQAEEGCYSSLPSMKTVEMQDDVVSLKKPLSPTKNKHLNKLVRKLTTNSAPTPDLYTSSNNSPRFSICSDT